MIDIVEIIAKLSRYRFVPLRLRHHRTKFRASVTLWFLLEVYRPRNRKGSAVRKGGGGGKGGSRDECTRKEWKTGGKGGGREEGSTPRYCTRLHGCAHNRTGPRKTPFQVRSPPLKNVLSPLCCSRPFRSNLLNIPDTHLSNADFFETPAVLSPRIIFRRGREIELLPPRGFQIRNYGNYGNVAEDEIF